MINNRPQNCGIGNYTFSLLSALQKLSINKQYNIDTLNWNGKSIEQMYLKLGSNFILEQIEETCRVASHFYFMFKIPKNYSLYHITNATLSVFNLRIKPCVATVHDMIPFTSPRGPTDVLIKKAMQYLNNMEKIICVSNFTKNQLIDSLEVDVSKVEVIHNGLDHEIFKQRDKVESRNVLGLDQNKTIVLHVGSEEPRKNIKTLLYAFSYFLEEVPEAILIRIGEGTEETRKIINELGIRNKVLYFKNVKKLEYFYNAADMFIFPSFLEGFGLPPLEAMSSGCPTIVSNNAAMHEVVGDGGILLDATDVDEFKDCMCKISSDHVFKAKTIERGIIQANKFSWEECGLKTLGVYDEILNNKY